MAREFGPNTINVRAALFPDGPDPNVGEFCEDDGIHFFGGTR